MTARANIGERSDKSCTPIASFWINKKNRDLSSEDKMLARSCIHSLHRISHFFDQRLCIKFPSDPASAFRLLDEGCTSGVSAGVS